MEHQFITHGSENSLDHDIYVILDSPVNGKEAKDICRTYKEHNANLITIKNGIVDWCYKGTLDECNNSIISTYSLHEQSIENPITTPVKRLYGLKMLRTIRGILSYFSRTEHRKEVKKALRSDDLNFKISVLEQLCISETPDFVKAEKIEVYKFLAFQLGQTIALLRDNKELYTKNTVARSFSQLAPFLDRQVDTNPADLDLVLVDFITLIKDSIKVVYKQPSLFRVDFFKQKEIIHTKTELVLSPVVVFDLDQTLYDESHRSQYRIDKDLDTYFSLCDKDQPIPSVVAILLDYYNRGYEIWLTSGRYEPLCLDKTISSLKRDEIPFHHIKLRGKDNFVPDYILKPAWMAKYIGLDRIEAVYDDQDRVIEGFRKKGLNVIDAKTLY